jgi:DNA-binding SARP family transcriptional activator
MPSDRSRVSSESPARLEVRLLGAVEVILDGRRLGAFNSLRLQRFLALITLRRHLQHRPRLAFELWLDSSERQALTNLRKRVHDFRHSRPTSASSSRSTTRSCVDSDGRERGRRAEVPRSHG